MKNLFHTVAIVSFLLWLIGFFKYDLTGKFHFLLITAVVASLIRLLLEIQFLKKPK